MGIHPFQKVFFNPAPFKGVLMAYFPPRITKNSWRITAIYDWSPFSPVSLWSTPIAMEDRLEDRQISSHHRNAIGLLAASSSLGQTHVEPGKKHMDLLLSSDFSMFFHHSPEALSHPKRHASMARGSGTSFGSDLRRNSSTGDTDTLGERLRKLGKTDGYGSIPIHTIFSGMNIHLPAILMFTRVQGFDTLPFVFGWCEQLCFVREFGLTFAICISWHVFRHSWKNRPIFSVSKEHIDTWALQMLGTCNLYICIYVYIYIDPYFQLPKMEGWWEERLSEAVSRLSRCDT